jgi:Zn-dependent protease with chaperone function
MTMYQLKTTFLFSLLTGLMALMESAIGGKSGMVVALFIAAVRNLHAASHMIPMQEARPASAQLFTVNPLTGGLLLRLFSIQHPIEKRIARLESMA